MNDTAIIVENLSKRYRIGLKDQMHDTLMGALKDFIKQPIKNFRNLRRLTKFEDEMDGRHQTEDGNPGPQSSVSGPQSDIIWALKDVSFEVKRGEVVGIIGRNGAGKSTLLKILARITEPTSGRAIVNGRIGSLLEVGTGMHPELTGRENIYLSGTILGMTKAEVDRKFEEIVEFAELGKFRDTPIKRYSSGMKVRLGFAIAAHLEPEILLVDEVLAVGDAAFQKKCLGKMGDVAKEGRTVLFVSHNMGAVQSLTKRCLVLNNGKLIMDDNPINAIEAYIKSMPSVANDFGCYKTQIPGFYVKSIRLDKEQLEYGFNKPLKFDLHLRTERDIEGLMIGLQITNSIGARIMTPKIVIPRLDSGDSVVSVLLENHYLPPGYYTVNVGMSLSEAGTGFFYKTGVLSFEISEIGIKDPFLTTRRDKLGVYPPAKYNIRKVTE